MKSLKNGFELRGGDGTKNKLHVPNGPKPGKDLKWLYQMDKQQ